MNLVHGSSEYALRTFFNFQLILGGRLARNSHERVCRTGGFVEEVTIRKE